LQLDRGWLDFLLSQSEYLNKFSSVFNKFLHWFGSTGTQSPYNYQYEQTDLQPRVEVGEQEEMLKPLRIIRENMEKSRRLKASNNKQAQRLEDHRQTMDKPSTSR